MTTNATVLFLKSAALIMDCHQTIVASQQNTSRYEVQLGESGTRGLRGEALNSSYNFTTILSLMDRGGHSANEFR